MYYIQGTVLSTSHILTHFLQHRSHDLDFIINPILQMRNLRHKEMKEFKQCHFINKWPSQEFNLESLVLEPWSLNQ